MNMNVIMQSTKLRKKKPLLINAGWFTFVSTGYYIVHTTSRRNRTNWPDHMIEYIVAYMYLNCAFDANAHRWLNTRAAPHRPHWCWLSFALFLVCFKLPTERRTSGCCRSCWCESVAYWNCWCIDITFFHCIVISLLSVEWPVAMTERIIHLAWVRCDRCLLVDLFEYGCDCGWFGFGVFW